MGWTTMHLDISAKQFFINMFENEPNYEMLDIAIKNFREVYIALKHKDKGYVYCQTYMLYRAPKKYENFGYKPVWEFNGPVNANCPKRILDLLTPLDKLAKMDNFGEKPIEWAKEWRNRCYDNLEFAKKLSSGVVIKMDEPVEFTSGALYQYFKKKGKKWYAIGNYGTNAEFEAPISFRGLQHMKYTFV